jgi:hypothetical protein
VVLKIIERVTWNGEAEPDELSRLAASEIAMPWIG